MAKKDIKFEEYISEQEPEKKPSKTTRSEGLWDLLSTMKFAIWVLILLGALSLAAMFVGELRNPEAMKQPPTTQIEALGRALMVVFQIDDPFRSWWYRLLLGLLSLSLFACILERTPIIWRLWTRKPPQDAGWLRSASYGIKRSVTVSRDKIESRLGRIWHWRIKRDDLWIGEHGRIGMWGPLFTHSGMLLIGLGALIGSFGGISEQQGGYSGDVIQMPGMPYTVRVDSFRIQYYPLQPGQMVLVDNEWVGKLLKQEPGGTWQIEQTMQNGVTQTVSMEPQYIRNQFNAQMDRGNIKRFSSWVTVIENGKEVAKQEIAVNSPLRREGYRFYQSSYDLEHPRSNASYESVSVVVIDSVKKTTDTLTLKPNVELQVPGDTLVVSAGELVPHFKLGKEGVYSESPEFVNPAVKLLFHGPKGFHKEQWVFLKFPPTDAGPGRYTYKLAGFHGEKSVVELATIFEIKKSYGGWILWLGFLMGTIGLVLCFYISHRVIYIEWPKAGEKEVRLTGLTRKTLNLYARQIDQMLEDL
jgi:cytochrome c biogenesis protein ResB